MVEEIRPDNVYGCNRKDLIGLSTDTKPVILCGAALDAGSTFHEADTNKDYIYTNNNWYVI